MAIYSASHGERICVARCKGVGPYLWLHLACGDGTIVLCLLEDTASYRE